MKESPYNQVNLVFVYKKTAGGGICDASILANGKAKPS